MNKKAYIAPTMEATNIETEVMMAASNELNLSNEVTEDDASMTNKHRGAWGNLWN